MDTIYTIKFSTDKARYSRNKEENRKNHFSWELKGKGLTFKSFFIVQGLGLGTWEFKKFFYFLFFKCQLRLSAGTTGIQNSLAFILKNINLSYVFIIVSEI